ncbi:MAG: putative tRNA threonylcarbamoyladenosine biosynthesis protein Gcp [Parcubacteria group bacterium GW2011_GWC1_36_9]|uniref:tRNA N6-adenosine threonylcarbamoyltransferase n=2 Tax=Parcubacteria group TaxID=1794811 RepID=A0A0G0HY23_9BACT|nr:MAG: putative tRNA threonylcarbamoyladenosine biosynthesis protein Gcp [Parcubacteria group bacterium GW2011_GWC1_36_9]KKQ48043.1 MAG: putative tRNA threonylcarbamoyladenosine biosynthesis protein Gcp [Candidatus Yanofskybacteria bacterium GW2011_GWC2_37_9]
MKILSIETSCDDTAISIMEAKGGVSNASFWVLANNSNSQINIHIPYGGVYPKLAKREHTKNLPIVLEACLEQAKLEKKEKPIDAIAVTYGPGLEMCLWEGIIFAQELAKKWNAPVIPVNHMEGHIFSVFGRNNGKFKIPKIEFPILSLLVSGGHTQLVLTKKRMQYKIIGKTLDDAVGEAFDKVARMLGLPYPGGPEISKLAEEARILRERSIAQADEPSIANFQQKIMRAESAQDPSFFNREKENQTFPGRNFFTKKFAQSSGRRPAESRQSLFSFSLPRPMLHSKNLDFSFAGLKTAVFYLIKKIGKLNKKIKSEIALEFENSAIECLVYKTQKAIEKYDIKTLIVAGGVACNTHLQREIKKAMGKKIKLLFPAKGLAGDNSLMIGIAGYSNYIKNKNLSTNKTGKVQKLGSIKAVGNLKL